MGTHAITILGLFWAATTLLCAAALLIAAAMDRLTTLHKTRMGAVRSDTAYRRQRAAVLEQAEAITREAVE